MAPIDDLVIRPIGPDAVGEGLALTVEANWNQTVDDWAFFIAQGTVFGARDAAGRLVATAAVLPYSAGFAWVSLVIVAKSQRGRGLGTQMLNQCIATLGEHTLVGILDATPAGERVYVPLGFKPLFGLKRWEGTGRSAPGGGERVRPLSASSIAWITAVDAAAFGASRERFLASYCARTGTGGFGLSDRSGYALVRPGRVASHVGPVIAPEENDALALIQAAIASTPGPIFLDVPDAWTEIASWLGARGFAVQRPFLRMALGREEPYGDPARVFATAGPEYG
jgi:GNAT superfamily N-acetyltransferase